jgi:hypothetical protein
VKQLFHANYVTVFENQDVFNFKSTFHFLYVRFNSQDEHRIVVHVTIAKFEVTEYFSML